MLHRSTLCCLVALTLASTGCAPPRVSGTGERLRVDTERKAIAYKAEVKVGEVKHKDRSGRVVGTSDVTRQELRHREWTEWRFYQGDQEITELDFFTIAGDTGAAAVLERRRRNGLLLNRGGLGLAAAGLIGLVASATLSGSASSAGRWMSGFIPVGGIMAYLGRGMINENHYPLSRALDAIPEP